MRKDELSALFESLRYNYTIIGPKIINGVILLREIELSDIPSGYTDIHGNGNYSLISPRDNGKMVFTFTTGPDSFKRFLHPPLMQVFSFRKTGNSLVIDATKIQKKPYAFMGMRACDIRALRILDHVFTRGSVIEHNYERLRKESIIIGVNCIRPNENCFCDSLNTGPEIKGDFDILITELDDAFLLEVMTLKAKELLRGIPFDKIHNHDLEKKRAVIENCRGLIKKSVDRAALPHLILSNLEHPRWRDLEERCLACGNCTNVCPTCFCSFTYDSLDIADILKGHSPISGRRIRIWDSCFSRNFARVHGGNFRLSLRARYRHWIAHKLAYWFRELNIPNCTGCGRCITWCPRGIDITQELEALKR